MRAILGAVAAVLIGLALFQLMMQPSGAERAELAAIFVVMAAAAAAAALFLPMMARRSRRLVITLFGLALISVSVAVLGLVIAANRMFFSQHDLTLLLVVLGFGLLAALGFAITASSALTDDLRDMASTAHDVSQGDLSARTGVHRADEIGELASDIDQMASTLQTAAESRDLEDERRREFFAAISHDLRTPLASMQAAVEALRDGVAPEPDRYYRSLQSDIGVLNSLVEDLFLLARIQAGDINIELLPTEVAEIADEAIEVLQPVAGRKNVDLRLERSSTAVMNTAPEAVSRVLRNLLDNAIRYAPSNSTVTVIVDRVDDDVIVSVLDDGPGFPGDFVDEAFDSFSRPDASRTRQSGGAGLGLAIARGFVVALGGTIWADVGPGGAVHFRLSHSSQ